MKKAKTIFMISAFLFTLVLNQNIKVMQDTENWKAIPDYEGYYEISDYGRIKSIARVIPHPFNGDTKIKQKYLSYGLVRGYYQVTLFRNGAKKMFKVSRLVLTSFIGSSNLFADHINGIRTDNRLINLRWASPRENAHYYCETKKHLRSSKYVGVNQRKDNKKWVSRIAVNGKRKYLGSFNTESEAAEACIEAIKTQS